MTQSRILTHIVALTLTLTALPSSGQRDNGGYLLSDKNAILLMPPTRVSDDVETLSWAPDGSRLLTLNVRPVYPITDIKSIDHARQEAEFVIGRWNASSHFADVLWRRRFDTHPWLAGDPAWVPGTRCFTQVVSWRENAPAQDGQGSSSVQREELLWIDAAHSTVHEIPLRPFDIVTVSPTRSMAVIVGRSDNPPNGPTTLTPLRFDGSSGTPITFNPQKMVMPGNWTSDGARLVLSVVTAKTGSSPAIKSAVEYNPVSGELLPSAPVKAESSRAPQPAAKLEVALRTSQERIQSGGADAVIHPLWAYAPAGGGKSSMLVSPDAELGILSPNGTAIAYRSYRSAWVAELQPVPLAEFNAMRIKAQRQVAISNGRQLALAAIMWAEDHDETLPGPDNINNELLPYLGSQQLFDNFTYTFAGGSLSSIESPAETVLGTVDGPGGQAVMYADGHVKWLNK